MSIALGFGSGRPANIEVCLSTLLLCAETGGAITLFGATLLGIPVSTTHTITGAIVGVGSARRTSALRWGVAAVNASSFADYARLGTSMLPNVRDAHPLAEIQD